MRHALLGTLVFCFVASILILMFSSEKTFDNFYKDNVVVMAIIVGLLCGVLIWYLSKNKKDLYSNKK